jgi:hypothetical protein
MNVDFDGDFDFGFTTMAEEVIKQDANDKAQAMYTAIMPLLKNLAKDADKNAYIHWPDRKQKIDQFIKKLDTILNS